MSWTVDDNTRADLPGELSVSKLQWIRHYPKWSLFWTNILLVSVVLGAAAPHWSLWVASGVLAGCNLFYWKQVEEHFQYGCLNPGVVVSVEPPLIAVSGNLTHGGAPDYNVVKIIEATFKQIDGAAITTGTRVPTVALYQPDANNALPRWEDFFPVPVICATGDMRMVQAKAAELPESEWEELRRWVATLPKPPRPGLYEIAPDV